MWVYQSVFSSFYLEGIKKMLRVCFRQSIFHPKAEKVKTSPLMASMPGFESIKKWIKKKISYSKGSVSLVRSKLQWRVCCLIKGKYKRRFD